MQSNRLSKKTWFKKYWFQIAGLFFISGALLFGVKGFQIVREYLTRASAEPANIMVDTKVVFGIMPRPWRNLAQGGEDHDWRLQPLVGQVRTLHPEYIRLDHIYDFYDIVSGSSGNLQFNWSKLDAVLNDIAATGAKPYIALSYMPLPIASADIVSPPRNYSDWQLVVQKTIEHISGTRSTPDVYYEVWNEPDLFGSWKTYGGRNYLNLYEAASRGAQQARGVQPFKLGGPATTALYKSWFDALLQDAIKNNLRLDFFSWHRYSLDVNQYKQDMIDARSWLQKYPQLEPTLEFHITEWGHDSDNNNGYDSAFGAAHTAAAAIEMTGVIDHAFVFEIQDGKDPNGKNMWGRWGLFTHKDGGAQAKPRYQALRMLEQLGKERIQVLGKGTYVKAIGAKVDDSTYQVLLANFDPAGRNTETVPVNFQHLADGTYQVTKTYLTKQKQTDQVQTLNASLQLAVPMGPSEVAVVEIKKL